MYTEMESRRMVVNMKLSSGPLFMRALKDDRIRLKLPWKDDTSHETVGVPCQAEAATGKREGS